jgi:ABC-type glycerol-3-phosphate transport system substrate-binding protein
MFKRWFLISLIGLALLILIAACGQTADVPEPAPADGRALIEDRCSDCHTSAQVFNANYDRDGWVDVFDEMIDKGAEVNPEEKEVMIDWLLARDQ